MYHLFYGDEHGSPGADLTFFEYPGAAPGRRGAGMVHRIVWRVSSPEALEFWKERLARARRERRADRRQPAVRRPRGPRTRAVVERSRAGRAAERATSPEIPPSTRCRASTACAPTATTPCAASSLLGETLGFARGRRASAGRCAASSRGSFYAYDPRPRRSTAARERGPSTTSRSRPSRRTTGGVAPAGGRRPARGRRR